ncbi:MAG: hypothetical protein M3132_13185 [Actinomycetia bacterium]|nr:hypothetical protein [Actinomycetes bacterium]
MRRFSIMGLLVAFALVVAACGGDEALSKDEYIAQANAICANTNTQLEAVASETFADLPDEPTPEEIAEVLVDVFIDQFTAALEAQLADLRALAAPEGDANLLAAFFDEVEVVLAGINQVADAAATGDPAAIEQLTASEDSGKGGLRVVATAFSEVDKRAIEYGLTVCGEG